MRRFNAKQQAQFQAKNERVHHQANKVKQTLKKAGYTEHMSLYGIITKQRRNIHQYRRVEIINNKEWTDHSVSLTYRWFKNIKPDQYYTIWIYNSNTDRIMFIGGWN